MAIYNHFDMSNRPKLDRTLKEQSLKSGFTDLQNILHYAESISKIENVIAVVSDIKNNISKIYSGRFGTALGIGNYTHENSIWERSLLDLMSDDEQEEKYLADLLFFHYLQRTPRNSRSNYYLASKLRIKTARGESLNILHRLYYIYSPDSDAICYALCLYGALVFDFAGKSLVINSLTGATEELASAKDISILSKREQQVLKLIASGKTSAEIADILTISKNTVNRHRQEILAKLQVKNSMEACKRASMMRII